ncbi:MAG: mechanosensitive ion channel [Algoriphagus sp.]|uniref:mechanosensitive ion channel domain-containing protein n=1 Tax=Algoriphagus sp. TaxID=1872435 RepID=UPI00181BA57B|nr:mechanosensitive ion channel domain-containing protein [Algoriphagus sp.]NVJ85943.1 mechanosensitive ion channel [Algoriphagus sp.]
MRSYLAFIFSLSLLITFSNHSVFGQSSLVTKILPDTSSNSEVQKESQKVLQNNNNGTRVSSETNLNQILTQLYSKTNRYTTEISRIRVSLQEPLDTAEMMENIPKLETVNKEVQILIQDTLRKDNIRYLKGISAILNTLLGEVGKYEGVLQERIDKVLKANLELEKIKSDTLLNLSKKEMEIIPGLFEQITVLKEEIKNLEQKIRGQELVLSQYQVLLSKINFQIISNEQYFRLKTKETNRKILVKELNYLWEERDENFGSKKSTWQVTVESFFANTSFVLLFFERNIGKITIYFLTFFVVAYWLKRIVKTISTEKDHGNTILSRSISIKNHPFISAFIVITPFFLVVFTNPPIPFNSGISFLFALAASWLIKDFFPKRFQKIWWIFIPFSLIGPTIGLNWAHNYNERYVLIGANVIGVLLGVLTITNCKKGDSKGKSLLIFLAIFIIAFNLTALFANVLGRFSLAKLLTITGVTGFFRGVALYIFTILVMEVFYLGMEANKNSTLITSYFDFIDLEKRFSGILRLFAGAIWLYGVLSYIGYYDIIYEYITEFLSEEYTIGNTTFTFGTIFLFILILLISSLLANIVAYFFSIRDQKNASSRNKRLGSSILLIRLVVIIIGFFIALTAAKIPIDRITIVLGALSVGIGFGLQTIINNLVSGIILAFERPIQIGDEIEVGVNKGTVKEVGIRASKILSYDGSEIVVPNGDLLSQSLINWTLSDKRRRIELIIGVSYESDMKKVKTLLTEALNKNNILKVPPAKVFMQNFGDSSVDFRLLFWVESMDVWLEIRSEVMISIFETFQENGVEIPYPKRDLYLKSLPFEWKETITKPTSPSINEDGDEPTK